MYDLRIGDIIFVRSGLHDFVHVGICVESGGTFATTKMAHTLGKMHPYCLVATHLATKEILDARDLHYMIIRPKSHVHVDLAVQTIGTWLQHMIPYDEQKYQKLIASNNKDILSSDYTVAMIDSVIQQQNELYDNNRFMLISLAATREIGPTPPVPLLPERSAEGIICTSPIIMSLQIAAVQHQVTPVSSFWVSDENVSERELGLLLDRNNHTHDEYLKYIHRKQVEVVDASNNFEFNSALRCLKVPLEQFDFSQVPSGLRLDPNLCPVSVLYFSLIRDIDNFIDLGNLQVPNCEDSARLRAEFTNDIDNMLLCANDQRARLYRKMNFDIAYERFSNAHEDMSINRPKYF
jgi:hypothetical protein